MANQVSDRLRVAMVVSGFPSLSQTFVLDQVRGLLERGHEVDILSLSGAAPDSPACHADVEDWHLEERTFRAARIPAGKVSRLLGSIRLFLGQLWLNPAWLARWVLLRCRGVSISLRMLEGIVPRLLRENYDVIHCQFGTLGNKLLALKQTGVPLGRLVVTFRGYDVSSEPRRRGMDCYDQLFQQADLVMVNCQFFADRLLAMGCLPGKLKIHRSGIACERFQFRPPSAPDGRTLRIVTVGRLVEKKGIAYGLEAIAGLVRDGVQLEYRIVGDGPLEASLKRQAAALGLQHVVRWLGALPQAEVVQQLQEADLFLASNVTSSQGDQDAPVNTLKEAMATGLPVVATRHGGIPELVEDGVSGFLVGEKDVIALQERIKWLLAHTDQWGRFAEAGRARVKQAYDLELWNDLLVERYQQVCNSLITGREENEQTEGHYRGCAA